MKKIISALLALTLMLAVCVPAFATVINEQTPAPQTAESTVQTKLKEGMNPNGTYTVTIPATIDIAWGAETTASTYSVESQLVAGKKLNVQVTTSASSLTSELKNAAGKTIAYTLSGDTNFTTDTEVVPETTKDLSFAITPEAWNAVPYDIYKDTLTFTVEVVAA